MHLPIWDARERILSVLRDHQVVIVVGETGSGKTTGLPVILHEAGYAYQGKIGITEPRVIAATSVAEFVARQMNTKLGGLVGYQVRFDDTTANSTAIKFMTDGILLRELQLDPDLKKYSLIMVDEAHERSQNIDFVLGLLKDALKRRKDLRVVVASATIDHEKFSRYFGDAPIVNVSGRMFPVSMVWSEGRIADRDMSNEVVRTIERIHLREPDGDVLVFMTGEAEIKSVIKDLEDRKLSGLVALPAYGTLAPTDQRKIFDSYPGLRKVVVATNIAETSITIDGVVYVIDSGLVKQTHFHAHSGIESLDTIEHSQAGCNQRAGRAGRTQPGVCYRMFTKEDFSERPKFTEPEIRRVSLAGVVLTMEKIGIENVEEFDFVDPPEKAAFHEAYEALIALGAIRKGKKGLTKLGESMAHLPLEPRIARMVLEADKYGCVDAVTTVAAFLSARNVYLRPREKEREADAAHQRFRDGRSDLMSYLKIWKAFQTEKRSSQWCHENFLNGKALREVEDIREQLLRTLKRNDVAISTNGSDEQIMKAIAAGLVYNLFSRENRHEYTGVLRSCYGVFVHPSSGLFYGAPKWLVATRIAETSKRFAHGCSAVDPSWLPDLVPHLVEFAAEIEFVAVLPNREGATIRRKILFQGLEVGIRDENVSLAKAHALWKNQEARAEAEGWIPLTFKKEPGHYGYSQDVARSRGTKYVAESLSVIEEGSVYYCKEHFANRDGSVYVSIRLKAPILPPLEEKKAPESATPEKSKSLDLSGLAEKWRVA